MSNAISQQLEMELSKQGSYADGFLRLRSILQKHILLAKNRVPNEQAMVFAQVLPVLEMLGWRRFDDDGLPEIYAEFKTAKLSVDVVLLWKGLPTILIEAKLTATQAAQQQLSNYIHAGCLAGFPISRAVVVTGKEWLIWSVEPHQDRIIGRPCDAHIYLNDRTSWPALETWLRRETLAAPPIRKQSSVNPDAIGDVPADVAYSKLTTYRDPKSMGRVKVRKGLVYDAKTMTELCLVVTHSWQPALAQWLADQLNTNIPVSRFAFKGIACPKCKRTYCNCPS